jgi:hypothetical protein
MACWLAVVVTMTLWPPDSILVGVIVDVEEFTLRCEAKLWHRGFWYDLFSATYGFCWPCSHTNICRAYDREVFWYTPPSGHRTENPRQTAAFNIIPTTISCMLSSPPVASCQCHAHILCMPQSSFFFLVCLPEVFQKSWRPESLTNHDRLTRQRSQKEEEKKTTKSRRARARTQLISRMARVLPQASRTRVGAHLNVP